MPRRLSLTLLVFTLLGCSPAVRSGEPGSASPLLASLEVSTGSGSVVFLLQVTNTSERPVDLTFPTGQSYDFAVRSGGRELWRWSADQMFTQAVRRQRLAVGESLSYEVRWQPQGLAGDFEAVGRVLSVEHPLQQAVTFRYP